MYMKTRYLFICLGGLLVFGCGVAAGAGTFLLLGDHLCCTHSDEEYPTVTEGTSSIEAYTSLPDAEVPGECVVGGCSGELCTDSKTVSDTLTTCEYREAYACYREAHCERQADGVCGWTMTETLSACLQSGGEDTVYSDLQVQ